jgi:hypothetical protein
MGGLDGYLPGSGTVLMRLGAAISSTICERTKKRTSCLILLLTEERRAERSDRSASSTSYRKAASSSLRRDRGLEPESRLEKNVSKLTKVGTGPFQHECRRNRLVRVLEVGLKDG